MRLSIQKLRWVLLAGAVLLIAVLTAFIGYGRYRALKAYRQIIARSGISLTHDSNGVSYSQSIKGRKIFTIRAKSESTLGNGKYALHNAELLLYDRNGHPADHIFGSEIEYDADQGIARANGTVLMDIDPPQGIANGGRNALRSANVDSSSSPVIHVRTSGLVYLRKLGVASTDQAVEFAYGQMHCTATGAEFNSDQSTVRLLANVHMDGLAHGKPIHVTADRADMDHDANIASLVQPLVRSGDHSAKADMAVLHLRKDGSIEQVQGVEHVVLTSGAKTIMANRLDALLNSQSLPVSARLTGNVILTGTDPMRPMQGNARGVDIAFSGKGYPTRIVASGGAKLRLVDRKADPSGLARSLEGDKIVALLSSDGHKSSAQITELDARGSAHASGETLAHSGPMAGLGKPAAGMKTLQVSADHLHVSFADSAQATARPKILTGIGNTLLQQDGPRGEQEISTGDTLAIVFASARPDRKERADAEASAMNIASAVQAGHVVIHDRAATKPGAAKPGAISTAAGNRATYVGASQLLTITGDAHLSTDTSSVMASTIMLNQRTEDADAAGEVQVSFQEAEAKPVASGGSQNPVTHVLASSAHFDHAAQSATFHGSAGTPVRMWQNGSQVQAATLIFDGFHHTFSARTGEASDEIHAVFASNPTPTTTAASPHPANIIRVVSEAMDYNDVQRQATFTGGVRIDGSTGQVRGQNAVVFLTAKRGPTVQATALSGQPNPFGGSVERVVVYGSVQMDQPGRHGSGDELLYNVAKGTYVLTGTPGKPPRIEDTQQGNVTGTTLVFGDRGSTIVVSGDQSDRKGKSGRVRTETYVHSGKPERE